MEDRFYGNLEQANPQDDAARHEEEIRIRGFTVVGEAVPTEHLTSWRKKVDDVYALQEGSFGRSSLEEIQELDLCRAPILSDFDFIGLAACPKVLAIVRRFLGEWFILNLQNATILRPGASHHQSSWHRDLPYQSGVNSKPIAISALLVIDDFSQETGGTQVVPYTHRQEVLPSDWYIGSNVVVVNAPAGSAVIFDSMLLHRAGLNRSATVRRAVNHLYTIPIIKQQVDFPRALLEKQSTMDRDTARLLGFASQTPLDDKAWRIARTERMKAGFNAES